MGKNYDVIVIGSGAGGLGAAVALVQAGMRVLVCEQHEVPGGWMHSFSVNGHRFSPGVHYIGELHPGGALRKVYEGLGVSRDLIFSEINPNGYDHIVIGDRQFDIPKGSRTFAARLKRYFPHESEGIDSYFNAITDMIENIKNLGKGIGRDNGRQSLSSNPGTVKWAMSSAQKFIEHFVSDPLLIAILSGQAGDHGMPPSEVPAFLHVGIAQHYFEGAYYPIGGGFAIPKAFVRALKRAGGEIRLKTLVERIRIAKGKAIGVRLLTGEEISADFVISNADPGVTFEKLVGRAFLSEKLLKKLDKTTFSISALSLFFAVDMDLRAADLDSGNYWLYEDQDIDKLYRLGMTDHVLEAESPPLLFMTVTTLKDPSKMHAGHHTCEAFTFVSYDAFQKWAHEKTGAHSAGYEALKEDLAWRMFKAIEKRIPGISKKVVFWKLGTPLTNEYYINSTRGNLYGTAKNIKQVGPRAFPIQTEIDGLLMCGASTRNFGVYGATKTGLDAAKAVLKCKLSDFLSPQGPPLKIYPAEDLSAWPENLQKRIMRGRKILR
jgi:phytoene dehydrogenase-like protein